MALDKNTKKYTNIDRKAIAEEFIKLLKNHQGKANAISVPEIARSLPSYSNTTKDQSKWDLREIIRDEVLFKKWIPIGSYIKGYYWITNMNELNETLDILYGRIKGLNNRITALDRAFIANCGHNDLKFLE